jgi:TPR repeat protein
MSKNLMTEHLGRFERPELLKIVLKLPAIQLDKNNDDSHYPEEKEDLLGFIQYYWSNCEINQVLKELDSPQCNLVDTLDKSPTEMTFHEKIQLLKNYLEKNSTGSTLHSLGYFYHTGYEKYVPQNKEEAFRWYFLSAKKGYPEAQCKVGFAYVLGKRVEKDWAVGHMWLSVSSNQGFNRARRGLNIMEPDMTQEELEKSRELRKIWEPMAI